MLCASGKNVRSLTSERAKIKLRYILIFVLFALIVIPADYLLWFWP